MAFSTLSVAPRRGAWEYAKRARSHTASENARRDREAIAGDWRRVGMDIRAAADRVMAGEG